MISVLSYFWWIFFRVMVLVFGNRLSFYINTKINTIKSNGTSCSWKKNVIFIFWALFWGMLHIHRPDTWNENSIATPLINKTSHSSVIFFFCCCCCLIHRRSFFTLFPFFSASLPSQRWLSYFETSLSRVWHGCASLRLSVSLLLRTTQRDDMLEAHPGWVARLQERCGWQDQPSTDYGSNACRQCKTSLLEDL